MNELTIVQRQNARLRAALQRVLDAKRALKVAMAQLDAEVRSIWDESPSGDGERKAA